MSEYVSPKIASHLRNLARDVAYTEGHASVMRAAADRIESLDAERDGYRALSRNHNADAVAQRGRADRADARLARVTDDSMLERIAPLIADMTACGHCDGSCGQCREDARRVLATIRAVAADSETVVNRDDDGKVVAADEQEAPNA